VLNLALRLLDDTIADRTDPKAIKLAIEGVISDMAFEVQQERLIDSESRF
jgi:predicted ATP-grasp superfamily ATP-dependent carboligase